MKTKRFLSILLSLVLVLGMLPGMSLTAFAADTTTTITPGTDDAKTGTGTMTITLKIKAAQTITASDVTATYGDTDKSVSASVTEPTTGGGAITYAVKDGSGDYIDVAADGKLTIKKVPPTDGKAYVIVKAAATDDYAETTREVTVTISKAEATVAAKDQGIMVGGTVPDLSAPVLNTHYSVTGLVGTDALTTAPTLAYQKNGSAATPDNTSAGTYDIVPSGASAGDNYNISYTNGTLTITAKDAQTITASDVTATYGETDKSVSATTDGNGEISYAVKAGSEDYISVASDGKLTIKKVPADGKAYVTVTASETNTGGTDGNGYAAATKDVTVNISKATVTITAKDQSIYVGGTVPTLSGADFYTVTGLVGEETLTTNPTLAYQKNGSAVTPDNTTAGTYDIVPFGAAAGDNYAISYTNGTLTITARNTQTITASDVTATYGDTDKSVNATTDGNGEISYTVKAGSENYIDVNTSTGALTIKAVPADGKAYVTVKATETTTGGTGDKGYAAATKDVTVNISKATVTITAKDQSIYVGGTVPTLSGSDFYTVTGLVGEDTLTTAPTLAYQKDGSAATPDNTAAGTYDIVASGASAGDNYAISYTKGTLTISEKQPATVTKAPTANTLTYNGQAQALVTSGEATGGEMQYALGTKDAATEPYTTSIPAKTDAGTYYVWYKAVGDDNHNDSEAKPVEVTIATGDTDAAAPKEQTLTYTGSAQPLVKAGSVEGGTLYYALGSNSTTAPADGWSTEVTTATEAGTYYVWYKVVGDANHKDVDPDCIIVTIGEAAAPATTTVAAPVAPAPTTDYTLLASLKTSGKKAFKMRWTAVPGAEGYDVFFGMCNKGDCQLLASVNGTSYKIKGLKKGFAYKGYVWAWKNVGGAKTYIGEPSPDVHAITNGKSNHYTNPKKISVKKKKLTVGVGKRKAIKAKLKKFSDSRNYLNHVSAKIRYYSSDRTVATVDAKGRVTGVGPGKCTVFAVAENGLRVGVKVTVK